MIDTRNIIEGDCLAVMPTLPENSIDAVVTDPPYGLSFMGKEWDHGVPGVEFWRAALHVMKPGAHLLAFGGTRTFHRLTCAIEDAGFEVRDCLMWLYGSGFPKSHNLDGEWKGWGTALKPAWEPIILARKPLEGTVAENVQTWGTGAINIDGGRIGTNGERPKGSGNRNGNGNSYQLKDWVSRNGGNTTPASGRWPANVLLDEEAGKALDGQSGERQAGHFPGKQTAHSATSFSVANGDIAPERYLESGGASRFFYCAKSKRERGEDNNHPTVKPIALLEYLIRLVTPPNGLVLDPFSGSGSTGVAAVSLGFQFLGIEKESAYCDIARKRIEATPLKISPQLDFGGTHSGATTQAERQTDGHNLQRAV